MLRGDRIEQEQDALQQRFDAHGSDAHFGGAGFQARDIEILGDHAAEPLDFVIDGQVHFAAAGRLQVVGGEQLGHALDGGEGRAHFVGDQRDDVVLGLLELVLAGDVGERADDAEDRAFAFFVGGDGGQAQGVVARARRRGW